MSTREIRICQGNKRLDIVPVVCFTDSHKITPILKSVDMYEEKILVVLLTKIGGPK